jgi:1-acyl-sn-glycerol-3-phosphate acyltransferase
MSARSDRALTMLRELSGTSEIDADRRLEDIGIDSLAFAELATALEAEFGVRLAGVDLDGSHTVRDVLRAIEAAAPFTPVGLPAGMGRLYALAEALLGPPLRSWFPLWAEGVANVPRVGPAIVAMNHESALDPLLVVLACPRRIVFMAKKELYKNAFVSWWLRELGAFRVDRDRFDLEAVGMGLAVLERGDLLGMYPEGTRSPGELLPFLHGAAWLALRTGVPIVPCAITGTERTREARRPGRVRVRISFAPPIAVERVDDPVKRLAKAPAITAEIRDAITRFGR